MLKYPSLRGRARYTRTKGSVMSQDESATAAGRSRPEGAESPFLRALKWIGLDLSGPDRSSTLQIGIYALLVFVPVAIAARLLGLSQLWLFITSAAAIVPLAKILGNATEELALRVGSGVGGLLNATFGNAVELIIAFFALQAGLYD